MAECIVCQEIVSCQKFLSCGGASKKHMLCLICIQKLTVNDYGGEKVVECPSCRIFTTLPFGDANKLETKLYVELVCDDCSEHKSIEDQWWCGWCELTTCSKCAMERHRTHDSNPWEKYEVPREIVRYFKSRIECDDFTNLKVEMKTFCRQLEIKLLEKIENIENVFTFVNAIENCFGNINTGPLINKTNLSNFEKKFKTLCHILNSAKSANKDVFEEPTDVANIERDLVSLPQLNKVIDLFQKEQSNTRMQPVTARLVMNGWNKTRFILFILVVGYLLLLYALFSNISEGQQYKACLIEVEKWKKYKAKASSAEEI